MEASTKNVLWKCFENGGGKKLLFENELPDGFDYQVNRFKLLKESVIPHENKFEAAFLVSVCSEEKVNDFVKALERQTGTNFNIAHGKRKQGLKNFMVDRKKPSTGRSIYFSNFVFDGRWKKSIYW